jgi:2,5-diamino-6-(ribosylamino)-4(3H)-pyrimidinone 5'-phosphate reductase
MCVLPKVIIHNSITLDGSLTGFEADLRAHYGIARGYKPDAHLIGSNTVAVGAELYGPIPQEEGSDFKKAERSPKLPYWAIVDSKGSLRGKLHTCRRFEYCRDVIVFCSDSTPKGYINHLKERDYDCHVAGKGKVDLANALQTLSSHYGVKTVLTDTGRTLGNLLIEQGLVAEVSLLVHPLVVGEKSYPIFAGIRGRFQMKLAKEERLPRGLVWLAYKVVKRQRSSRP